MNNKIIEQLVDRFSQALSNEDAIEFTLQILVWIRLSEAEQLPASVRIDAAYAGGAEGVTHALQILSQEHEPLDRAFDRSAQHARSCAVFLTQALAQALRARDAGILANLDISEVASFTSSWRDGEMVRPKEVVELMIGLCALEKNEMLYVPWDFRGQFAEKTISCGAKAYIEVPLTTSLPVLVGLLSGANVDVHVCDPIRSPSAVAEGRPITFPVAAAFPPFNLRYDARVVEEDLFGRFPEKTQSGNVLWIRHLLSQTSRRIVVAITNNLLFGIGAEKSLREDLIRTGNVHAVVAMPAGLMFNTGIAFSIIVLDPRGGNTSVRLVDADTDRFREPVSKAKTKLINLDSLRELILSDADDEDVAIVSNDILLENDVQLQVTRYVLDASKRKLQARIASERTVALEQVASTIRPLLLAKDTDEAIQAFEVGVADLPSFGYIRQPGRTVNLGKQTAHKSLHQFLKPFDIVLIVKGSIGKVGIVPPHAPKAGEGGWVAGQSAIVLRVTEGSGWDPRTLFLQLRSPVGQHLLESIKAGASIPMIQLRELMRLAIIVPSAEAAHRASQALEKEEAIQRQIDDLRDQQATIAADVWSFD